MSQIYYDNVKNHNVLGEIFFNVTTTLDKNHYIKLFFFIQFSELLFKNFVYFIVNPKAGGTGPQVRLNLIHYCTMRSCTLHPPKPPPIRTSRTEESKDFENLLPEKLLPEIKSR